MDRWWRKWQKEHPKTAYTYSGNIRPGDDAMDARRTDLLTFHGLWADTPVQDVLRAMGGLGGGYGMYARKIHFLKIQKL